jgi:hypothetical protein
MLRSRVKNGAELTEPPNTGGIGELTAVDGRLRWTGHVPTRGHGRTRPRTFSASFYIASADSGSEFFPGTTRCGEESQKRSP